MSENLRWVGPVLLPGGLGAILLRVLRASNPRARVDDRGGYLRVSSPTPCVLPHAEVEAVLGQPFVPSRDLEPVMPAFRGRIEFGEQEVRWL